MSGMREDLTNKLRSTSIRMYSPHLARLLSTIEDSSLSDRDIAIVMLQMLIDFETEKYTRKRKD